MNIFKVFSLLYLLGLIIFALFLDHSKNTYTILAFQMIVVIYFIIISKFKEFIFIFFLLYTAEYILLKFNIYHKNFNSIEFDGSDQNVYESSSIINYLYSKKLEPLKIGDLEFVPLSNLSNTKIFNGRVNNKLSFINSDELGFFNLNNNDKYNYIFLGDSFLNFTEIDKNKSFTNLMRNKKIYNMSVANSGPLTHFALVKEYIDLPKFKNIKKVIWFHSEENDLARPYIQKKNRGGDLNIEYSLTLLKKYLNYQNYKQNIFDYNNEINFKLKKEKFIQTYDKKVDFKRNFFLQNFFFNTFHFMRKFNSQNKIELIRNFNEDVNFYENQLQIMNKISFLLKKYLEKRNISLVVVILPDKFNCSLNKKHFLNEKLTKNLELNKINYLDGTKAFIKKNKCKIDNFNRYGHFSQKGHKNMSDYLKIELKNYQ